VVPFLVGLEHDSESDLVVTVKVTDMTISKESQSFILQLEKIDSGFTSVDVEYVVLPPGYLE